MWLSFTIIFLQLLWWMNESLSDWLIQSLTDWVSIWHGWWMMTVNNSTSDSHPVTVQCHISSAPIIRPIALSWLYCRCECCCWLTLTCMYSVPVSNQSTLWEWRHCYRAHNMHCIFAWCSSNGTTSKAIPPDSSAHLSWQMSQRKVIIYNSATPHHLLNVTF